MTLVLTYVQYVHAYNKVMSKEIRHIQPKDRRQSPYSDKVLYITTEKTVDTDILKFIYWSA